MFGFSLLFSLEMWFFVFKLNFILYWGMVDLQCFVSFRFTAAILFYIYPFFFNLEIC